MTSEPTADRNTEGTADDAHQQPDAGTREMLDEAEEATDLPRGATPETPQHRSSSEQLEEAEAQEREQSPGAR